VSDLVLAPLGDLGTATRLAIVADGALQYLPFEALPVPSQRRVTRPLVADFEIVTLPSASTLAVQRQQLAGRPRPPRGVAVFADPVFDTFDPRFRTRATSSTTPDSRRTDEGRLLIHAEAGGSLTARIPRLPFTGEEADAILAAAAGQRNFSALGFAADKTAATSAELSEYRYIHFATHGVLDAERPSLSALVLSLVGPDGQPREGFLRTHELYNLDLHADLVVLSACQTGLGKEINGEGIVGLTRGLMYAGASRVIVSLWSVSDRATASLMGSLYRAMLKQGQAPAAALRAAQLSLMRDPRWRQPYYWAAFTLQGEWN
jgi:CHAT domain-containing protein